MIINQIEIFNYGKWHHLTLPVRSKLEIFYGCNEAGKTTLLSFIRGVLFGYLPRRTSHKNYIPRQAKNYGGRLKITSRGHQYVLERRSGKRGGQLKIFDRDGEQLPSTRFRQLMGPIDRTTFNALFYFGNVDLARVVKMKKRDLVQEIQKIGITNGQFWLKLRQQLVKSAKRIYSPRGYRPILNQKLRQYERLSRQVQNTKHQYTQYLALIRDVKRGMKIEEKINHKLRFLNQSFHRLHQLQNHWLQIQRLNQLKKIAQRRIRAGFSSSDRQKLHQLQKNNRSYCNQMAIFKHRFQDIKSDQDQGTKLQLYQSHRSLINNLVPQFNQISTDLHQQTLQHHYFKRLKRNLQRLRPYGLADGGNRSPLTEHEIENLKEIQNQIDDIHKRINYLKAQKLRLEAYINTPRHQDLIFNVHKLVPGVGLLVLNLSLIKAKDLKRSDDYRKAKGLYRHPERLQKQLDYQRGQLSDLKRSLVKLGEAHHYSKKSSPDQWLSIQNDLRQFRWLKQRLIQVTKHLRDLKQGLNHYFQRWRFLSGQGISPDDDGLRQVKSFVQHSKRALKRNYQLQGQLKKLRQTLNTIHEKQLKNHRQLERFYRSRQIKNADEFNHQVQLQIRIKDDQQAYRKLTRCLKLSKHVNIRRSYNFNTLQDQIRGNNQERDKLNQRLQKVVSRRTTVKIKLNHLVQDGSYDYLKQKLANAETKIIDLARKWLVARLTGEWIDQALDLANHNRIPKIERHAKTNFYLLTDHHYKNILFNKTRTLVLSKLGHRFNLYELSKGTLQQLYLALVFAFAEVLGQDFPMPVLIDDGFTDFDIHRRQAAWRLLKKLSHQLQIIYCTSDNQVPRRYRVDNLNS